MTTPEKHDFTLIVNMDKKEWDKTTISFEQVVKLAFPNPPTPPPGSVVTYTVEYERGPKENPEGSLTKGHSVEVKSGMVFNVTETIRS
jgi:hypothetical protein